jgi:hypothetical protein
MCSLLDGLPGTCASLPQCTFVNSTTSGANAPTAVPKRLRRFMRHLMQSISPVNATVS